MFSVAALLKPAPASPLPPVPPPTTQNKIGCNSSQAPCQDVNHYTNKIVRPAPRHHRSRPRHSRSFGPLVFLASSVNALVQLREVLPGPHQQLQLALSMGENVDPCTCGIPCLLKHILFSEPRCTAQHERLSKSFQGGNQSLPTCVFGTDALGRLLLSN